MKILFQRLLNHPKSLYIINGIGAVFAVTVVILILSSNLSARKEKIAQLPTSIRQNLGEIERLKENLAENPQDVDLNIAMGNSLFDLGKYIAAIPFYQRALTLQPENVEARIDLGVCYFNMNMPDSAARAMHQALQVEPTHVKGLFNLGVIYYNMGDITQAKSHWQRLIELHGGSQEAKIAKDLLSKINS
jgi:cytochrome c-type biogenesis protein CcmH/NrfG